MPTVGSDKFSAPVPDVFTVQPAALPLINVKKLPLKDIVAEGKTYAYPVDGFCRVTLNCNTSAACRLASIAPLLTSMPVNDITRLGCTGG